MYIPNQNQFKTFFRILPNPRTSSWLRLQGLAKSKGSDKPETDQKAENSLSDYFQILKLSSQFEVEIIEYYEDSTNETFISLILPGIQS